MKRIEIIDAARGLAVILMVFHHFLYDLVIFLDAPSWLFWNPLFNVLHYFFAGLFILLSGISSRFSRSNIRRGIQVLVIALLITAVSLIIKMPIYFGILHLLGTCMLLYGITEKFWEKRLAPTAVAIISILLFFGSLAAVELIDVSAGPLAEHLWIFGWTSAGFYSTDYFPLFPWMFIFLFGTWVGGIIRAGRFPDRFYDTKVPLFPPVGRKALIIYVVHQPVLYGIVMLIAQLR